MMSDYGVGALGGVVLIDPDTGLPYKAEGGGGGGAVDSVNGQTGAAVLSLQDVVDAGATVSGQVQVMFLDDPESPTKASVLNFQALQLMDTSSGARAHVYPGGIALQAPGSGGEIEIRPHADQDVPLFVSLPSASGTLARIEDLAPGAVDSVNGQTGDVELTLGDVFTGTEIIEGDQQTLMMVDDMGSPNDVTQLARGGITVMSAAQGLTTSLGPRSLTLSATAQGQGHGQVRAPESGSSIVTLPSSSGTLALQSDVAEYFSEIPGYDAGETQTLKNVAGVLTWVTDA